VFEAFGVNVAPGGRDEAVSRTMVVPGTDVAVTVKSTTHPSGRETVAGAVTTGGASIAAAGRGAAMDARNAEINRRLAR
jgi:hypothetical protein